MKNLPILVIFCRESQWEKSKLKKRKDQQGHMIISDFELT